MRRRAVDACNPGMVAPGHDPMGEYGTPGRRYFRKGRARRTHHMDGKDGLVKDLERGAPAWYLAPDRDTAGNKG